MGAGFVGEQGSGGEVVVDGEVDLAGAVSFRVDDEGGGGVEAFGEVGVEEVGPEEFGG